MHRSRSLLSSSCVLSPFSLNPLSFPWHLEQCLKMPGSMLFYSGGEGDAAHYHWIALFPFQTIHIHAEERNPWNELKKRVGVEFSHSGSPIPLWWGFLSYEMGCFADRDKYLKPRPGSPLPLAYFQRCLITMRIHCKTGECTAFIDEEGLEQAGDIEHRYVEMLKREEGIKAFFSQKRALDNWGPMEHVGGTETEESYKKKVQLIQEQILSGNVYQINLSHELRFRGKLDPLAFFVELGQRNPAPFSTYLQLGEQQIISSSPERFLCRKGNQLEVRPIKGTMARGRSKAEDERNRLQLISSEKDSAELLMITDLMRNDLSRVCIAASVKTPEVVRLETYQNVFHLVSRVQGECYPQTHPVDILRACFPGGSITGCPKLRAMELIDELEQRPRMIYTGSMGYLSANGDFDFNIGIRTALAKKDQLSVAVGGAIVIDSDPEEEWLETLHKGRSIFQSLGVEACFEYSTV